jgi:hypothetical protein
MEIGEKPAWVEKEGVRFAYCARETPNVSQLSKTQGDIGKAEARLFNSRAKGAALFEFVDLSTRKPQMCLEMTEPVTRERTEAVLDLFIKCRRMLLNPTNEELLELVSDADPIIRDAARLTLVKSGKR